MKKNIGKILLIVLPVVFALWLLYPTYQASELEDVKHEFFKFNHSDSLRADSLFNERIAAYQAPADSIKIMVRDSVWSFIQKEKEKSFKDKYGEEYESAKSSRLKLGLDLRGGMYVTLEVDVVKLIEEAAQKESKDEVFEQVIEATRTATENTDANVIEVFLQKFKEIAEPKKRLLSDYFDPGQNVEGSEDESIIENLKNNESEAIDRSLQIIRQRVDKYGVSEPTIQKIGSRRIMLELPGVKNEQEVTRLIQTTARLEFHLVKNNADLILAFSKIDRLLAKENNVKGLAQDMTKVSSDSAAADSLAKDSLDVAEIKAADSVKTKAAKDSTKTKTAKRDKRKAEKDSLKSKEADSLLANKSKDSLKKADSAAKANDSAAGKKLSKDEEIEKYKNEHPFTELFHTEYQPEGDKGSQQFFYAPENMNLKGDYFFRVTADNWEEIMLILERPDVKELLPDGIVILRDAEADVDKNSNVKSYGFYALKSEPELSGDVVTDAGVDYDQQTNRPEVRMSMNSYGADIWSRITGQNIGKRIAIVLDGVVYSAPNVITKIPNGISSITGMKDVQEANLLKIVLKAGALKAPVRIMEQLLVGPSLGEDAISSGLTSFAIAFVLIVLFMVVYYMRGGMVAIFAVFLNVLIIIALLAGFKGTLTLPGIAGIILTIGMAVDANILIFERIREELFRGRSIKSAVDEGFSKALSAIVDSNITTFITGLILFFLGTGPIQGFALTLMFGIFGTMFTAITVSRAMIEITLSKGVTNYNFGQPKTIKA